MKLLSESPTIQSVCVPVIASLALLAGLPVGVQAGFEDGFDTYTNGVLAGQGDWVADPNSDKILVADSAAAISSPKVLLIDDDDSTSYGVASDVDGRINGNFSFHARHLNNNLADHSNPGVRMFATVANSAAPDPFFQVSFLNDGISWLGFAPGGVGNGTVSNVVSTLTWYKFEISFELGPNGGNNLVDLIVTESISGNPVMSTNLTFVNNQGNRYLLGRIGVSSGSSHDPAQYEFDDFNLDAGPTNCPPVAAALYDDFDAYATGDLFGNGSWQPVGGSSTTGVSVIEIPDPISCFNVVEIVDADADSRGIAADVEGGDTGQFQFYARPYGNNPQNNSGLSVRMYATVPASGAPDRIFQVGFDPGSDRFVWTRWGAGDGSGGATFFSGFGEVTDGTWYRFDVDYEFLPNLDKQIDLTIVEAESGATIVSNNILVVNNQGGRDRMGRIEFLTGSTHDPTRFQIDHISLPSLQDFSLTSANANPGANQMVITWDSQAGATYEVQRSTDLVNGTFLILQTAIPAFPPSQTYTDTVTGIPGAAYRIKAN